MTAGTQQEREQSAQQHGARLLGVALADGRGKLSQFFEALAARCELVELVDPRPSRAERYVNRALTFHPDRRRWRARAGFNGRIARARTRRLQHALSAHQGSYDLIFQLQTLCAPARSEAQPPYAIYTDNTMALTQRLYPLWAPLSDREAAAWMTYEAEVCRAAAITFTMSDFARRSVIDDYGCAAESVVTVGGGANQMLGSLAERGPATATALFVGVNFARKGGPVLLDAWPAVRARVPNAELVIAGPAQRPAHELPPGVRWIGPAGREQLTKLYRTAAVFVLPSLFEPWGLVFDEAMGHGLPCIGTECCAMPEIIEDRVSGRLVARGEAEPLAQALVELLSDRDLAAEMGRAAYARVQRERCWSDVAGRVARGLEPISRGVGAGGTRRSG